MSDLVLMPRDALDELTAGFTKAGLDKYRPASLTALREADLACLFHAERMMGCELGSISWVNAYDALAEALASRAKALAEVESQTHKTNEG